MSVAASKESARHLLRKWLLRSEEKQPQVVVKQEVSCFVEEILDKVVSLVIYPSLITNVCDYRLMKKHQRLLLPSPRSEKLSRRR